MEVSFPDPGPASRSRPCPARAGTPEARISASATLLALVTVLSMAVAACGPVTGTVRFEGVTGCPEDEPTGPEALPAAPSLQDLQCILTSVRQIIIPTVAQDLVAAQAASELASGETNVKLAEKLAGEGQWWAERALFHAPGDPAASYWLAANLGQLIIRHPLKALKNLGKMERSLKRAAEGVPDLEAGGPLRVLGMLYVKAPSWPQGIGDSDKGLDLLKAAVERHPEHPLNPLFLAQAQWDVDGDAAREEVAANLATARRLMASKAWGYPALKWKVIADDLARLAAIPESPSAPATLRPLR